MTYEHRDFDTRFEFDPWEYWDDDGSEGLGHPRDPFEPRLNERRFYLEKGDRIKGGLKLHQLALGQEFTRLRGRESITFDRFRCTHMLIEDSKTGEVYVLAERV